MQTKKIIFTILLVFTFASFCEASENTLPIYSLEISFDIENSLLQGIARITFPKGLSAPVNVENLSLTSIEMNGEPVRLSSQKIIQLQGSVFISYKVHFKQSPKKKTLHNPGGVTENFINKQGIYLNGDWYPALDIPAQYHLQALVPGDFTALSEADMITEQKVPEGIESTFNFPHPRNGMTFIASEYNVTSEIFNNIELFAYL